MNAIWKEEKYFQWFLAQNEIIKENEQMMNQLEEEDNINDIQFHQFLMKWKKHEQFEKKKIFRDIPNSHFLFQMKIDIYQNYNHHEKYKICHSIHRIMKQKDTYLMKYIVENTK